MGRVAAQSKMRRCGIKQRIKWLTIFLWVFATLKLIFTESCDLSYEMELLKMRMHKNCLLNHYSIEAASSILSRQRELLSSRPSLWMPAFSGVTPRDDDRTRHNRGFSLVELSIVLVILGLLVGGVLTGKSLIRAAELRSVTTEMQAFTAAAQTFKDKYQALPGDMTNATMFWGENATHCDTAAADGTPGTCNGNGDGVLRYSSSPGVEGETYMFWNQLALAGMITGTYNGIAGSGAVNHSIQGQNVPKGKISSTGWDVYSKNATGGDLVMYNYDYKNTLLFGGEIAGDTNYNLALTPEEGWNIDKKVDDGLPAKGNVLSVWWADVCASADDGSSTSDDRNASYRVTDNSPKCALAFKNMF